MTLQTKIEARGFALSEAEERHVHQQLEALSRRLVHFPEPIATAVLTNHPTQRAIQVDVRVQLGPLGAHLIAHETAETVVRAMSQAIADVERQLERHLASQRGEPSFGVPSRRSPRPPRTESGQHPESDAEENDGKSDV